MKKVFIYFFIVLIIFMKHACANDKISNTINEKLNLAHTSVKKNPNKAWESLLEIATILKKHPQLDDGEFAEEISQTLTRLLLKPWPQAKLYVVGCKSKPAFRSFILKNINELTDTADLKQIETNIASTCDTSKTKFCRNLIRKIQTLY